MESVFIFIWKVFAILGICVVFLTIMALLVYIACQAWISASNRFRDILKAESLIYRYKKEEKLFRKWIEEKEGDTY